MLCARYEVKPRVWYGEERLEIDNEMKDSRPLNIDPVPISYPLMRRRDERKSWRLWWKCIDRLIAFRLYGVNYPIGFI